MCRRRGGRAALPRRRRPATRPRTATPRGRWGAPPSGSQGPRGGVRAHQMRLEHAIEVRDLRTAQKEVKVLLAMLGADRRPTWCGSPTSTGGCSSSWAGRSAPERARKSCREARTVGPKHGGERSSAPGRTSSFSPAPGRPRLSAAMAASTRLPPVREPRRPMQSKTLGSAGLRGLARRQGGRGAEDRPAGGDPEKLVARGRPSPRSATSPAPSSTSPRRSSRARDPGVVLPLLLKVCIAERRYRVALDYAEPELKRHPGDYRLRFVVASFYATIGDDDSARERARADRARQARLRGGAHYALAVLLRDEDGRRGSARHAVPRVPAHRAARVARRRGPGLAA